MFSGKTVHRIIKKTIEDHKRKFKHMSQLFLLNIGYFLYSLLQRNWRATAIFRFCPFYSKALADRPNEKKTKPVTLTALSILKKSFCLFELIMDDTSV